ncbi:hypothetical protein Micbo1qcDRAFT_154838 [Microdochium bolleyi]|uniref:Defect at low temperature protein 1 n=1 Tax=Microdochium bolleyi TaxID=196109 RepID=A0A136JGM8_9PEZI|nr:hypothetical protein Micbo1qcDRAFT_154838 [Microdochium bolleyi]
MSPTRFMFRIVYNSIYVLLCIITSALLVAVPGDIAIQAIFTTDQSWINIIILAITYSLALLIILFVYITRLYITRMALAAIPRAWIPIEKADVSKDVREMIMSGLGRSAVVAWAARPKVTSLMDQQLAGEQVKDTEDELDITVTAEKPPVHHKSFRALRLRKRRTTEQKLGIDLPVLQPVWGHIEHNGWASPNSPDLPNLQYSTVLAELPNLIEAKAIAQAPPSHDNPDELLALDPEAVELLALQQSMSMRDYVLHLVELGVLSMSQDTAAFLDIYERTRFSARPMSEDTFRQLMHLFAELLRSMQPLDLSVLYASSTSLDDDGEGYEYTDDDGHIDDDAPQDTRPTTPARSIRSYQSSVESRVSPHHLTVAGYQQRPRTPQQGDHLQRPHQHFRTAPTTPRSRLGRATSNQSFNTASTSGRSFAQTKRPYPASQSSSSMSNGSLRSGASGHGSASSQTGSVIRLATADDEGDLPYVLTPVHSHTY